MLIRQNRKALGGFLAAALLMLSPAAAPADELVRLTLLASGTAGWEVDTIKQHHFDATHGVDVEAQAAAGKEAADIALLGGATDVIVTDWIWVNRERAAGKKLTFMPFSRQVGSIDVAAGSPIQDLAGLRGKKIGVAGGPLDKSWILIQALAKRKFGLDLTKDAEPVYGAPPLISAKFKSGELDAVLTFWQFAAKLEAAGARRIAGVADASKELGLNPEVPLLGFVFKEDWAAAHPAAVAGLQAASRDAKTLLATSDAEWVRLRPIINPTNDAEMEQLKAGYRAGIPVAGPIDTKAASALLRVLSDIGGAELVGDGRELQAGTFAVVP